MCHLLDIEKTRTCPYRPQNGGEVQPDPSPDVGDFRQRTRGDWDKHLPFVMLAYRSTEHESIGCMPNQMVFDREVTLPVDLMFGSPPQAGGMPACPVIYVEWLRAALKNAFE